MSFVRKILGAAVLSAAFAVSASAMTVAPVGSLAQSGAAALYGADALVSPRADLLNDAASSYFDYDALVTLAALVVAGGAMAAFGALAARRRSALDASESEPAWRTLALRAVEADLAAFTNAYRRAA